MPESLRQVKTIVLIIISLLMCAGLFKQSQEKQDLQELLYQLGTQSNNKLIVSQAPPKTIFEKVTGKKKIPKPAGIPDDAVHSTTLVDIECPSVDGSTQPSHVEITLTTLTDGTVVTESTGVVRLLSESYNKTAGYDLSVRLGLLLFPTNLVQPRPGIHIAPLHYKKMYLDTTAAGNYLGGGLSYNYQFWIFKNLYMAAGFGYDFRDDGYTPYTSVSVRF